MRPAIAIIALWIAWAISWIAAASWTARTEKSIRPSGEIAYRALMIVGYIVLAIPAHGYEGPMRLWHVGWGGAWGCVALIFLGFAFCWWARIHLGLLWSGNITKKADHHLIDSGPYAIVRHPIYTGILAAVLGTMIAKGTILGIVGTALSITGLWMKARLEEGWLRNELGPDTYDAYRRRVPMLVPFGPKAK